LRIGADWNIVEPRLFAALGIPLVRGRDFDERDTATSLPVAIVNEAFARVAWPNLDPIGRQMEADGPSDGTVQVTVVGVAADARMMSIAEPAEPYIYVPLAQRYTARTNLLVKTAGASTIPELRTVIREMNSNLPVTEALTLSDVTALGTIPQRIAAAIAGTLGLVGLLLAALGIYGVTSYAVNRRRREIGIRVALGAERRDVMRLILTQGAVLALVGVGIGLCVAAAGAQLIRSLLFGVSGVDPLTFAVASLLFTAIALLATYIPARRALNVDPIAALRND
jgi:predicted permease